MNYIFCDGKESADQSHEWALLLEKAHTTKSRPLCVCQRGKADLVPMYVARINESYVIKRMPGTGSLHHSDCDHYEPPLQLSGLGQVEGTAIKDDKDHIKLALDFALTKGKTPAPASADENKEPPESVRADGTKLTMRGLLHYLLDQAQLTKWTPAMAGKRSWYVVQREMRKAAAGKVTKGQSLADVLLIPRTFNSDQSSDIIAQRKQFLAKLSDKNKRLIVMAPLKEVYKSGGRWTVMLKHLPDLPLSITEDLNKQIGKAFAGEQALHEAIGPDKSTLLLVGVIWRDDIGIFHLERAHLTLLDEAWMPIDSMYEAEVLTKMRNEERRFSRALRYNLPKAEPIATAILTDTDKPTAMFLVTEENVEQYRALAEDLETTANMAVWYWRYKEMAMAQLPAKANGN